jgi:hypothetical protein
MNDRLEIASRLLAAICASNPDEIRLNGSANARESLELANVLIEEDKKSKIVKEKQDEN